MRRIKNSAKMLFANPAVRPGHKKFFWPALGAAAAGLCICLFMGAFTIGTFAFEKQKIDSSIGKPPLEDGTCYVPNVSGMSYKEAEDILKQKHLKISIDGINYSDSIEKDIILSQHPQAGNVAASENTVSIVVSGGTSEVMVPDFTGMTYDEAKELANAQHLEIQKETQEDYHDVVAKGSIITQNITPKKRVAAQTEISLTVSLGRLSEETALLTVPNITGISQEQALKRLEKLKDKNGFTYSIGNVKNQNSTKVEKGDIISQLPKAGTSVRTNEPVDIVISSGPEMIQVPQVVNKTRERAIEKLKKAGFAVDTETDYSSQVSAGFVISQNKESGTKAAKGSSIKIVISAGVQPVQKDSNNSGAGSSQSQSSNSNNNSASSSQTRNNTSANAQTDSHPEKKQVPADRKNNSDHEKKEEQQQKDTNTKSANLKTENGTEFTVEW